MSQHCKTYTSSHTNTDEEKLQNLETRKHKFNFQFVKERTRTNTYIHTHTRYIQERRIHFLTHIYRGIKKYISSRFSC